MKDLSPRTPCQRFVPGAVRRSRRPRFGLGQGLLLGAATLFASCGGGGGSSTQSSNEQGELIEIEGHGRVFVDANRGGAGQQIRITRVAWGRLVEVFGRAGDPTGPVTPPKVPMHQSFVIAGSLISDGQNFLLETNPVTTQQTLTIEADVTTNQGMNRFYNLLREAEQNLTPVFDTPVGGAGIFTMVPRNSAVVVQFDDLIDQDTLDDTTVQLVTGVPPATPFESRLLIDPNHGDAADHDSTAGREFYSTRVIIDTTVSLLEAFDVDPPLPVNGVGFPGSVDSNLANVQLRIPTEFTGNQNRLLANPTGHYLTTSNSGSFDPGHPAQPVTRAARSGGKEAVTGDPFNGFLPDSRAPEVVGTTPTVIDLPPVELTGENEFLVESMTFASTFCTTTPEPGDVVAQPGVFAEVIQSPGMQVTGGVVTDMQVRLLLWPRDWTGAEQWVQVAASEQANFLSAFDPVSDSGKEACFVAVFPTPTGFPNSPTQGLTTNATMGVRFSEPMDPSSLTAFDSMTLTREPLNPGNDPPLSTSAYVVGKVTQTLDLQSFTFVPDLPLAHAVGQGESYFLSLVTGNLGPTDLAGNELAFELPQVLATMSTVAATQNNGGRVSRFNGQDEEPPEGPEWSGQHLYDLDRQLIRPRPVQRFQAIADRTQPVPSIMTPFAPGVQTPLSNLGSKMQTLWRYVDFGFSLTDTANYNIDVEGMHWSPVGGQVIADTFEEFEIQLSHSAWAPDEFIDPSSLFPQYPQSGLQIDYIENPLEPGLYPQRIVHPKFMGYDIVPGDLFTTPTGTRMMPYPLNLTRPMDEWLTYTWRDTSIPERAGNFNGGVDPRILYVALGLTPPANQFQTAGQIQTIGLPLLMEFRCYPDDGSQGVNAFDISLAVNSSARPYFRAFSSGGINTSGLPVQVDPDIESQANGGFNPTSTPTPGETTQGRDPVFYIGALDMVVRVSRSYSVWFPASNPADPNLEPFAMPIYSPPVLEPRLEDLPDGTSIELGFRGAVLVDNVEALTNAVTIDNYGDHYFDLTVVPPNQPNHNAGNANLADGTTVTFMLPGEEIWREDISEIDEKSYYQIRATFFSNTLTGLGPELSALAVSWQE
ncbi:MAG: Ig-like domain-containing protein [bacterium]|nr:Ig-like domain-containing protein [bacterium]